MKVIEAGTRYSHIARAGVYPHCYSFRLEIDTDLNMDSVRATKLGRRMAELSREQPAHFPLNFVGTEPASLNQYGAILYNYLGGKSAEQVVKVKPSGNVVVKMVVETEVEFTGDQGRNFERILEKLLEDVVDERK